MQIRQGSSAEHAIRRNFMYSSYRAFLAALGATVVGTGLPVLTAHAAAASSGEELEEVVITGSIIRRVEAETASPVTVVTAEMIEQRGQTTIQDAIQSLASNNGPALTNSFTANGAFAGGASAVSLRALSTNSTLVLFDGMRAAYYPLADDGTRNFVDLNTIPDDVVERIEVLRDGASASYGADAIAGVVNIITKKQFQGISARMEMGQSSRKDADNNRMSFMAGTGDLGSQGYNVYVSGFYTRSAALKNSDRPYPYNSDNQGWLCFEGNCGPDNRVNGLNQAGAYTALGVASNFLVRPYNATNTTAQGRYQMLNPSLGCGNLTPYTLTSAEFAAVSNAPPTVCQEDLTKLYGYILPEQKRFGFTSRATVKVGEASEGYLQLNVMESDTGYYGLPATIRANAPAGIQFPRYSTSTTAGFYGNTILTLPVWVCAAGVNCQTATDGHLNPNNPFAAAGNVARLLGRLQDFREHDTTRNRAYRLAGGLSGKLFGDWDYNFGFTAMHTDLLHQQEGYVFIQHLLNVIAQGTYNFVNPSQNSKAINDYLAPVNRTTSTSDLYQAQFTLGKTLMTLPGGPLQLGFGASIHNESVDAPSANADYNGATERYFRLNAFGTSGSRAVSSGFAELNVPFTKMIEANVAGRYDRYSTGQNAFSPKVGLKFTPFRQLAIRGTYSRGFRIPSFAESNALPTTGFVTANANLYPNSYLAAYGCTQATFSSCPAYLRVTSYGLTSLGTPNLKPEKSESYTVGMVVEPLKSLSLTVDYYHITKTNAITGANAAPAIAAYYSGQAIPAGYTVIPDAADVNNPTLQPRIAFVQSGFVNANQILSEGIDFGATEHMQLGRVKWTSTAEASYIMKLTTSFPDGTVESYAGTLGNFNLTAGSGTPRWHGNWENTFDFGKVSTTLSMNYFGGYNLSAADQGTQPGDCGLSSGFTPCDVSSYITWDLTGNFAINDHLTVYGNIINVADRLPPIDPVTYGAVNYNPVQGGEGIIGRQFRLGLKAKL
jgi:iron complex outermembrane receptor protein